MDPCMQFHSHEDIRFSFENLNCTVNKKIQILYSLNEKAYLVLTIILTLWFLAPLVPLSGSSSNPGIC